jgi:uracil-DNA glycosylase
MGMLIDKSWHEKLKEELQKPYIKELKEFLEKEKVEGSSVYPPEPSIFHAFAKTPYEKVKVVIVGQDPYHGRGQAHGLSFSVLPGIKPPPSLQNIFKELHADLGVTPPSHGCLDSWAEQGVLLLNATLTVRAGEPKSHHGKGWELFTDAVMGLLAQRKDPIVFLLWGKSAQEKCHKLLHTHHAVFTAAHPSPYSVAGFLGCKHFSKANAFLNSVGKGPVDWTLK